MAKKRLTGNNKTLSDDWEETLRQIRTQTAVDFTMTGEEKARKLRELEADPVAWAKFMFYRYAKYEFAGFQKKAIRRIIGHSDGNWYEVLSWARELAKSTIVMFIVLYPCRSWRWAGDSHRAESKWTRYARTYCSWMTTIPTRNAAIRR